MGLLESLNAKLSDQIGANQLIAQHVEALEAVLPEAVSATEFGYLDGVTSAIQTQIDTKPTYTEATVAVTFTQAVGAKTIVVRKAAKLVTLEIPAGTTADGGGAAIQSGATELTADYRPAADISFPVIVTENAAKAVGKLVITSAGRLNFYSSAADGVFTDDAAAGFDRVAVTYSLA